MAADYETPKWRRSPYGSGYNYITARDDKYGEVTPFGKRVYYRTAQAAGTASTVSEAKGIVESEVKKNFKMMF